MSTAESSFDWGQNPRVSALYDVINSPDITFNVSLTETYDAGYPYGVQPLQKFGGGHLDPRQGGGNVFLDPRGSIKFEDPMGVVFMHEVVGHGHPVGGNNAVRNVEFYYTGRHSSHAGYHKIIGWKKTGLYRK